MEGTNFEAKKKALNEDSMQIWLESTRTKREINLNIKYRRKPKLIRKQANMQTIVCEQIGCETRWAEVTLNIGTFNETW